MMLHHKVYKILTVMAL